MLFDDYCPDPKVECTISMENRHCSLFEAYDGRLGIPNTVYEIKVRDKTSAHGPSEMQHFCSVKVKRGKKSVPVVIEAKNDIPVLCYYESNDKLDKNWKSAVKYTARLMLHNLDTFIDIWRYDNQPDFQNAKLAQLEKAIEEYDYNDDYMLSDEYKRLASKIDEKHKVKKFIYRMLSKISKDTIYNHYYSYIRKKKSNTVRLNLFPTKKPYGFPICFFEDLIEVTFEGELFWGSKYYDEYLKIKYGEYMQLPPVNERKVHPVVELRL